MLCVWKINGLMRELLILCRCAKGSASPGYQGCHYAFTRWEQGGPPDSSLFPEWCHSCSEGKPDDTNKPGRLLSTFPLPLKHSQKREFFPQVRVSVESRAHCCWSHTSAGGGDVQQARSRVDSASCDHTLEGTRRRTVIGSYLLLEICSNISKFLRRKKRGGFQRKGLERVVGEVSNTMPRSGPREHCSKSPADSGILPLSYQAFLLLCIK